MKRGDFYRVARPRSKDPEKHRAFVVVSRQVLIDSKFSSVICAPVYSAHHGLSTQVAVGVGEGLKHNSSIHCDELVSLPKAFLTDYIGCLSPQKVQELDHALCNALSLGLVSRL